MNLLFYKIDALGLLLAGAAFGLTLWLLDIPPWLPLIVSPCAACLVALRGLGRAEEAEREACARLADLESERARIAWASLPDDGEHRIASEHEAAVVSAAARIAASIRRRSGWWL